MPLHIGLGLSMKRRDFLKWSAGAASLAISGTGWGSTSLSPNKSGITIAGIGGCGVRTLARLLSECVPLPPTANSTIRCIAVDTDNRSLKRDTDELAPSTIPISRVWIEADTPSCADPERGRRIAREHEVHLVSMLELDNTSLIVLLLGMGRGCGTGFAQSIASMAQTKGVCSVALPILPFSFCPSFCDIESELTRLQSVADSVQVFRHLERPDVSLKQLMTECEHSVLRRVLHMTGLRESHS